MHPRLHLFLGLLVAAPSVSGCYGSGVQPNLDASLEIRVVRGPIHPVEREGMLNAGPVPGARVTIRHLSTGASTQADTNQDGIARVSLSSGDYVLEVTRCPAGTLFSKTQEVTVQASAPASVTLTCDTGIR